MAGGNLTFCVHLSDASPFVEMDRGLSIKRRLTYFFYFTTYRRDNKILILSNCRELK